MRLIIFSAVRSSGCHCPPHSAASSISQWRQSCAFRDHVADLAGHGAAVISVSMQSPADQREFADREHIPTPYSATATCDWQAHWAADVRRRGDTVVPAADVDRARAVHYQGLLPRLPTRAQRVRRARVACGQRVGARRCS